MAFAEATVVTMMEVTVVTMKAGGMLLVTRGGPMGSDKLPTGYLKVRHGLKENGV
jgi:hypothetical protein